jgi:hypothetical protein
LDWYVTAIEPDLGVNTNILMLVSVGAASRIFPSKTCDAPDEGGDVTTGVELLLVSVLTTAETGPPPPPQPTQSTQAKARVNKRNGLNNISALSR